MPGRAAGGGEEGEGGGNRRRRRSAPQFILPRFKLQKCGDKQKDHSGIPYRITGSDAIRYKFENKRKAEKTQAVIF